MSFMWDTLSIDQYKSVDKIKKRLRKGNWRYLREHPEIRAIMRVFLHHIINKQADNVYDVGAQLFNLNRNPLLVTMINQQLKRVNDVLKSSRWSEYDGEMLFGEAESSHSLASKSSQNESANSLLSYACIAREREKEML